MRNPLLKPQRKKNVSSKLLFCVFAFAMALVLFYRQDPSAKESQVGPGNTTTMEGPLTEGSASDSFESAPSKEFQWFCDDKGVATKLSCEPLHTKEEVQPAFLDFIAAFLKNEPASDIPEEPTWDALKTSLTTYLEKPEFKVDAGKVAVNPELGVLKEHQKNFLTQNPDILTHIEGALQDKKHLVIAITGAAGVGKSTVVNPIIDYIGKLGENTKVLIDGELFREEHKGLQKLLNYLRDQHLRVTYKFQDLMKTQSKEFKSALWKLGETAAAGKDLAVVMYPTVISTPTGKGSDPEKLLQLVNGKKFEIIFIECLINGDSESKSWLDGVNKRGRESGKPASTNELKAYIGRSNEFETELKNNADKYGQVLAAWNNRYQMINRGKLNRLQAPSADSKSLEKSLTDPNSLPKSPTDPSSSSGNRKK